MSGDAPFAHDTLTHALASAEREVGEFFGSLSADEFVLRTGAAWTPSEHLEHLNIAVGAVARGFALPPWLLRLRFRRSRRPSRTYEQLRDDYRTLLAGGAGASGRYVPGRGQFADEQSAVRRTLLLSRWYAVNEKLQAALRGWSEENLERLQLPHPILGMLTAREMVFFTIYHGHHHVAAAKRRLPRFNPTGSA